MSRCVSAATPKLLVATRGPPPNIRAPTRSLRASGRPSSHATRRGSLPGRGATCLEEESTGLNLNKSTPTKTRHALTPALCALSGCQLSWHAGAIYSRLGAPLISIYEVPLRPSIIRIPRTPPGDQLTELISRGCGQSPASVPQRFGCPRLLEHPSKQSNS